jgi:hypothetical protein
MLPVILTREEREAKALELSKSVKKLTDLKNLNKEAKKEMKESEDLLEAKVKTLARIHRDGKEDRAVEVIEHADIGRCLWVTTREDTGEQVRTRPMSSHDLAEARQERLPGLQ